MTAAVGEVAVEQLLDRYFDALYAGDADQLATILHPSGIYATAHGGELLRLDVPAYLELVAGRAKPVDRRAVAIDAIDLVGSALAVAKVRCRLFGRDYADILTLLMIDGRWWVMAKVFDFEEGKD